MRLREFVEQDYVISNRPKLDKVLVKLCELVINKRQENPNKFGWVASAIIDNQNNTISRTSELKEGLWSHAERNAMDAYEKEYGEILPGCIIVTTLTPCSEEMQDRYGSSCTDYINGSNIRKVYCGYSDPSQNSDHNEFNEEITKNPDIKRLCKKLADTFLD